MEDLEVGIPDPCVESSLNEDSESHPVFGRIKI